jgi:signal transduction histidine kinase
VNNAIRYTPGSSTVTLSCWTDGVRAWLCVADEGQGLTQEQVDRLFAKFERLGRSGDGGTGLGLYISRRLARAMGGDLSVEATPGQGARFVLELPADTNAEMDASEI